MMLLYILIVLLLLLLMAVRRGGVSRVHILGVSLQHGWGRAERMEKTPLKPKKVKLWSCEIIKTDQTCSDFGSKILVVTKASSKRGSNQDGRKYGRCVIWEKLP